MKNIFLKVFLCLIMLLGIKMGASFDRSQPEVGAVVQK